MIRPSPHPKTVIVTAEQRHCLRQALGGARSRHFVAWIEAGLDSRIRRAPRGAVDPDIQASERFCRLVLAGAPGQTATAIEIAQEAAFEPRQECVDPQEALDTNPWEGAGGYSFAHTPMTALANALIAAMLSEAGARERNLSRKREARRAGISLPAADLEAETTINRAACAKVADQVMRRAEVSLALVNAREIADLPQRLAVEEPWAEDALFVDANARREAIDRIRLRLGENRASQLIAQTDQWAKRRETENLEENQSFFRLLGARALSKIPDGDQEGLIKKAEKALREMKKRSAVKIAVKAAIAGSPRPRRQAELVAGQISLPRAETFEEAETIAAGALWENTQEELAKGFVELCHKSHLPGWETAALRIASRSSFNVRATAIAARISPFARLKNRERHAAAPIEAFAAAAGSAQCASEPIALARLCDALLRQTNPTTIVAHGIADRESNEADPSRETDYSLAKERRLSERGTPLELLWDDADAC